MLDWGWPENLPGQRLHISLANLLHCYTALLGKKFFLMCNLKLTISWYNLKWLLKSHLSYVRFSAQLCPWANAKHECISESYAQAWHTPQLRISNTTAISAHIMQTKLPSKSTHIVQIALEHKKQFSILRSFKIKRNSGFYPTIYI